MSGAIPPRYRFHVASSLLVTVNASAEPSGDTAAPSPYAIGNRSAHPPRASIRKNCPTRPVKLSRPDPNTRVRPSGHQHNIRSGAPCQVIRRGAPPATGMT